MRIGIMTFWWSDDNYGQILQCYALQKYLINQGHDAFLVRYLPKTNKKALLRKIYNIFNLKKLISFLKYKYSKRNIKQFNNLHQRHFDTFRNENLIMSEEVYSNRKQLVKAFENVDLCIVGSDQLWNFSSKYDVYDSPFTLRFLNNKRKISYAVSFGSANIDVSTGKALYECLRKFEAITVRETEGLQECSKIGINAKLVCDPTLLLSVDSYKKLFDVSIPCDKKYIFLYLLSNPCDISIEQLKLWASKNNYHIVYVTGNKGYLEQNFNDEMLEKNYLTINQWLYFIYNADFVISNSFHCAVFSLLFNKKYLNVPLIGKLSKSNGRIDTLFDTLKCNLYKLKNNNFDVLKTIETKIIDEDFIKSSKLFLEQVLEDKK